MKYIPPSWTDRRRVREDARSPPQIARTFDDASTRAGWLSATGACAILPAARPEGRRAVHRDDNCRNDKGRNLPPTPSRKTGRPIREVPVKFHPPADSSARELVFAKISQTQAFTPRAARKNTKTVVTPRKANIRALISFPVLRFALLFNEKHSIFSGEENKNYLRMTPENRGLSGLPVDYIDRRPLSGGAHRLRQTSRGSPALAGVLF